MSWEDVLQGKPKLVCHWNSQLFANSGAENALGPRRSDESTFLSSLPSCLDGACTTRLCLTSLRELFLLLNSFLNLNMGHPVRRPPWTQQRSQSSRACWSCKVTRYLPGIRWVIRAETCVRMHAAWNTGASSRLSWQTASTSPESFSMIGER